MPGGSDVSPGAVFISTSLVPEYFPSWFRPSQRPHDQDDIGPNDSIQPFVRDHQIESTPVVPGCNGHRGLRGSHRSCWLLSHGWGGASFLGPANQTGDKSDRQVRMARPHPHRESMQATVRHQDLAHIVVGALRFLAFRLQADSLTLHQFPFRSHAPEVEIDGDILRSQAPEMNLRVHPNDGAHRDVVLRSVLDRNNPDVLPFRADAIYGRGEFPRAGGAVRFQCAESFVGRGVVPAGVIADHAVGVYEWAKRADGRLHALNPLARNAVGPAIVEGGNDIALQQIVERLGFHLVLVLPIGIIFAVADGPAHLPRILRIVPHLVPPAVGHAQVEYAVGRGLHAAGAAGFVRTQRCIQPEIDTLHQIARHRHIVVREEDNAAAEFWITAHLGDATNHFFAGIILGVRLAGKDDLQRTLVVGEHAPQAIEVAEDERGPLVGGKAAGESDSEGIWVQHLCRSFNLRLGRAPEYSLVTDMPARPGDEPFATAFMRTPQLLRRNGTYAAPGFAIGRLIAPLRSQVAVIKLVQLGGKPAAEVNAVGDVPDGNLLYRHLRPDGLPHLPADLAMQLADAVGARRQSQSQDRHAEFAGPAHPAEIAKFVQGEA